MWKNGVLLCPSFPQLYPPKGLSTWSHDPPSSWLHSSSAFGNLCHSVCNIRELHPLLQSHLLDSTLSGTPHPHSSLLYWTSVYISMGCCQPWSLDTTLRIHGGISMVPQNCWWKNRKNTVQGPLLYVFSIEVVFGGNVVENGSGLYQLHPINFDHRHLLEHQTAIFWKKKTKSRVKCLMEHTSRIKKYLLKWLEIYNETKITWWHFGSMAFGF